MWYFAMVLKSRDQHVYVGSAGEACNGSGARVEGVMSVAVWAGKVGRKRHEVTRKRSEVATVSVADRVRALHGEIQDLVCTRTLTQSDSADGRVWSRGRVLNAWGEAMDRFECLAVLDANAPDRTDRRPIPRDES